MNEEYRRALKQLEGMLEPNPAIGSAPEYAGQNHVVETDEEAVVVSDHAIAINELCIAEEKKDWEKISNKKFGLYS